MVTSCPVLAFQCFVKAALYSTYSSRVGSYDTLSSVTGAFAWANAVTLGRDKAAAAAAARGILIKLRRCVITVSG
jgi:hypothetical protein